MNKLLVTVDIVLFTIRDRQLHLLLIRRLAKPFQNRYALPGGFVLQDESLDSAAERELREETGLDELGVHLAETGLAPEAQIHRIGDGFPTAAAAVFRMNSADGAILEALYEPPRGVHQPPRWSYAPGETGERA